MFPNGTFQNSVSLLQAPFFVTLFLRLGRNVSMWAGICSYNIYKYKDVHTTYIRKAIRALLGHGYLSFAGLFSSFAP